MSRSIPALDAVACHLPLRRQRLLAAGWGWEGDKELCLVIISGQSHHRQACRPSQFQRMRACRTRGGPPSRAEVGNAVQ